MESTENGLKKGWSAKTTWAFRSILIALLGTLIWLGWPSQPEIKLPPQKTSPLPEWGCDINRAPAAELALLPGIGPVLAQAIIDHRPYQHLEDLQRVPGLGPKTLYKIKDWLLIKSSESSDK